MPFDATLGGSTANSLVSVADAIDALEIIPSSDGVQEWLALIEEDQERTLVASSLSINALPWKGTPCSSSQSLSWPRVINYDGRSTSCESLPFDVTLAVAYTAAFMGQEGGYVAIGAGGGVPASENLNGIPGLTPKDLKGYEAVELGNGAIRLKLSQEANLQTGIGNIPPFALDLILKYTKNLSGGLSIVRVRNSSIARTIVPSIAPASFRSGTTQLIDGKLYPLNGGWASNPLPGV